MQATYGCWPCFISVQFQLSMPLHISAPIIIGNVPLRSEWSKITPPISIKAPLTVHPTAPALAAPPAPPSTIPTLAWPPPAEAPQPGMPAPYAPPMGMDEPAIYPPLMAPGQPPAFGSMGQQPLTPGAMPPLTAPILIAPYPDMPPPSYMECFGEGSALKDEDDNAHIRAEVYKPLYPTYSWN